MSAKILMPKKVDLLHYTFDILIANISNVDIYYVTLSPQILNL